MSFSSKFLFGLKISCQSELLEQGATWSLGYLPWYLRVAAPAAAEGLMDSNLQGDGLGRSGGCDTCHGSLSALPSAATVKWHSPTQPAHLKGLMGKCIKLLNA